MAITFLRRGNDPLVTSAGDLDNRIKTLWDCLRMPHTESEMNGFPDAYKGKPFFSVLEDDSLVGSFSVSPDEWLKPGSSDEVSLLIKVTISTPV